MSTTSKRSYERATDSRGRAVKGLYVRDGRFVAGASIAGRWQLHTLKAETLTDARRERESWLAGLREGRIAQRDGATFTDVFTAWQEGRTLAARTAAHEADLCRTHLASLADRPVQSIDRRTLARLLKELRASRSEWTAVHVYRILRGTLDLAVRDGILVRSPVDALSAKERPKQKNAKDIARLDSPTLAAIVGAAVSLRWQVAIGLAAWAGLRVGEVRGLQWQDVDFEQNAINVRRSLSRKGETQPTKTEAGTRVVPLFPELRSLLLRWRLASPHAADGDLIVSTADGGAVSERNANRALAAAVTRAYVDADGKRLSFHSLRHSAGSNWITELGLPITTVSVMLGHADPSITLRIYARDVRPAETMVADVLARVAAAGAR